MALIMQYAHALLHEPRIKIELLSVDFGHWPEFLENQVCCKTRNGKVCYKKGRCIP